MKRFLLIGAAIGFVLPASLTMAWLLNLDRSLSVYVDLLLWPSSIMLMVTEGSHSMLNVVLIWGISISINMALYSLLGLLVYAFVYMWKRTNA
jgi:hypothetical protein